MLGEWKLLHVQETFSCKTTFFKIDQLIAENSESSKQTFDLSHVTLASIAIRWGGSQIKSIADQDCSAPYLGADFTEYQWRRCSTMIGEKPKWIDCILCMFKAYSVSKKILVHHSLTEHCKYIIHCCENRVLESYSTSVSQMTESGPSNQPKNNNNIIGGLYLIIS